MTIFDAIRWYNEGYHYAFLNPSQLIISQPNPDITTRIFHFAPPNVPYQFLRHWFAGAEAWQHRNNPVSRTISLI